MGGIDKKYRPYYFYNYDWLKIKKGGGQNMLVTLSELKANPGKYVDMVEQQSIYIIRNGKKVARLTTARPDKLACASALFGILPENVDLDAVREERLK